MVARLWWKEARLFWPIAALLVLLAELAQVLTVYCFGHDARTGVLAVMALGWACLYGFAVASASLAGERENGTLWLLDALPAGRGSVWAAKLSFALGSTVALGSFLVALSSFSTESWQLLPPRNASIILGSLALLQVLGWGFFSSAICGHALTAAVLAVCSMGLTMPLLEIGFDFGPDSDLRWLTQLLLAAATIGASAYFFIKSGPPRRPIVKRRNVARDRVVESYERAWRSSPKSSPAWPRAAWSLAWQTAREIGWLWWRLALIGLVVPVILSVWSNDSRQVGGTPFWALFNVGAGILAGVNIFGTEYGSRTRRFLVHHAARPGMIWMVKTLLWLAALAVIWLPAGFMMLVSVGPIPSQGIVTVLIAILSLLLGSTVLGQLCGMIFPRRITAGLIALLALIAILLVVGPLFGMQLMPAWMIFGIPLVILAVSFSWSGEWLLDRPGGWRWVKLGLLLFAGFGLLFAGYAYDRAEMVPVLDPVAEARLFTFATAPRQPGDGNDAKALYAEALKDAAVLDLIRMASALPAVTPVNLDRATIFSPVEPIQYSPNRFTFVLALSVAERQAKAICPAPGRT